MEPTQAVACHEVIEHDEYPVHQWRVTQLKRLGIPGPLAEADADKRRLASDRQPGTARLPPQLALRIIR